MGVQTEIMGTVINYSNSKVSVLRVSSYNLHGFNNGFPMLRLFCIDFDVIMISEHWLLSQNLDKLGTVSDQFNYFGVSSMDLKVAANILVGRPFGGVAIYGEKPCLI